MIIDGHVHPTLFVDAGWSRNPAPVEKIIKHMDGPHLVLDHEYRIDMAVCQPAAWETIYHVENHGYSFVEQHSYISQSIKRYPDRLVGCMNLNPRFGVDKGLEVLEDFVKNSRYRALKLHANHHVYRPETAHKLLDPIFDKASRLRIPVLIHTGDTPFSAPAQWADYVERYTEVNIVLCHYATQMISYAYEAMYLASKNNNLFLEVGWAPESRLREGVQKLGADRFIFGTDTPPNEMTAWLKMVEALTYEPPFGINLNEEDLFKILGGNMRRLLRL
jgi:predicted TIM-barrel fold metal-dependent hydrolase